MRRTLFGLWACLSLAWLGVVIWLFFRDCFYAPNGDAWCHTGSYAGTRRLTAELSQFDLVDWAHWMIIAIGPSLLSAAVGWGLVLTYRELRK